MFKEQQQEDVEELLLFSCMTAINIYLLHVKCSDLYTTEPLAYCLSYLQFSVKPLQTLQPSYLITNIPVAVGITTRSSYTGFLQDLTPLMHSADTHDNRSWKLHSSS